MLGQSPSQKRDPETDHRNPNHKLCAILLVRLRCHIERLLQEAVTGGGVNRERKGLIRDKAAEGSGRRQLRAVVSTGSGRG